VGLAAVEIEQLLGLSSTSATATLADETLVDYLAAKIRASESSNEPSLAKPSWSARDEEASSAQLTYVTAVNDAIAAELDENHRFSTPRQI